MTILAYHSVSDWQHPLAVDPNQFARQLDYVSRFAVVSVAEHLAMTGVRSDMRRIFSITFDDGYVDFVRVALPLLRERGLPATVFAPAGLVGNRLRVSTHEGENARPLMGWEELRACLNAGIDIGSHSLTHAVLPSLDDDDLNREVTDSKAMLEKELGTAVHGFCYPAGWYDERVTDAVNRAGYAWGVATPRRARQHHGRLAQERLGVYRHDSFARFRLKLTRGGDLLRLAKRATVRPSR